jgi:hypothetical protein
MALPSFAGGLQTAQRAGKFRVVKCEANIPAHRWEFAFHSPGQLRHYA